MQNTNIKKEDEVAKAMGYVLIWWAYLEANLDGLLVYLLDLKAPTFNAEVTFDTITHNIDFRAKIQIIVGLGCLKSINNDWFNILKWSLDKIDNDLRVRRNRTVHDRLIITSDKILQIQTKTGFRKPKSYQLEYFTEITREVDIPDIQALTSDI